MQLLAEALTMMVGLGLILWPLSLVMAWDKWRRRYRR